MYKDDIKLFAKEWENLIKPGKIYSQDIGWNMAQKNMPV